MRTSPVSGLREYTIAADFNRTKRLPVSLFLFGNHIGLLKEHNKLNWALIVLGIVIVGLEAGYIFAFKAGWQVSTAQVVQAAILAGVLIFVGWLLYHETLTRNKSVGIEICLIGRVFINLKT